MARLILDRASVVELCCGCGYLYEYILCHCGADYLGIDLLLRVTSRLREPGARVERADISTAPIPPADVILMLGALYHFYPNESALLCKMAASGTGIVLEPVRNVSQSANPLLRLTARSMSFISGTSSHVRLTPERMDAAVAESGVEVLSPEDVLGGRYRLTVFRAEPTPWPRAARRSRT